MTWAGRIIIVIIPKNISCNVIKAASVLCHSISDSFSAQKNYPCCSYIVYNLLCIKYRNKEVLRYDLEKKGWQNRTLIGPLIICGSYIIKVKCKRIGIPLILATCKDKLDSTRFKIISHMI